MTPKQWSWLLTAVGCTGLLVVGAFGQSWGWAINLGSQALWITYALKTKQPGFIAGAAVYSVVYLTNLVAALSR